MQGKKQKESSYQSILCSDLLKNISQNNTFSSLELTGVPSFDFLANQPHLFALSVIGAFKKNHTLKTLVFNQLSLNSIKLLLPALSKIETLIIENQSYYDIMVICQALSQCLPFAPELIVHMPLNDQECNLAVADYNTLRISYLNQIHSKKRPFLTTGLSDIQTPRKKPRLEPLVASIIDNYVGTTTNDELMPDMSFNYPHTLQLAILQNPELFFEFQAFLHPEKNPLPAVSSVKDNTPAHAAFLLKRDALQTQHLHSFNAIRQALIISIQLPSLVQPSFIFQDNTLTQSEANICAAIAQQDNVLLKNLLKKLDMTQFSIHSILPVALEIAANKGNRAGLNLLLGGKIRMIMGELDANNMEAVLAERELLIIKRPQDEFLQIVKLGFKNDKGCYQEEAIGCFKIIDPHFENGQLCTDPLTISTLLRIVGNLPCTIPFFSSIDPGFLKDLNTALIRATQNGYLALAYDLLDYIHRIKPIPQLKPAVYEENYFTNLLGYLSFFAATNGHVDLLAAIKNHSELTNAPLLFKEALLNNQAGIWNFLLEHCFFSDEDIRSFFQLLLYTDNALLLKNLFLDKNKPLFQSLCTLPQHYTLRIIKMKTENIRPTPDQNLFSISNFTDDQIILYIKDTHWIIEYLQKNKRQSVSIDAPHQPAFMSHLINQNQNDNDSLIVTSDWVTRHFRLLLLSAGISLELELDPLLLADVISPCSLSNDWANDLAPFVAKGIKDKTLEVLINNPDCDLARQDNLLIKKLAEQYYSYQDNHPENPLVPNQLGYLLVRLFSDMRIHPQPAINNTHGAALLHCIDKGYHQILKILIQCKPQDGLSLSDLFLVYPKETTKMLQNAVNKKHNAVILYLLDHMDYKHYPSDIQQQKEAWLGERKQLIFDFRALLSSKNFQPEYIMRERVRIEKSLHLLEQQILISKNKFQDIPLTNTAIIKVFLNCLPFDNVSSSHKWQEYLKRLTLLKIPYYPYVLDCVLGWPKMKIWSELKSQHGFFVKNESEFTAIPKEICDLITSSFIRVHKMPT